MKQIYVFYNERLEASVTLNANNVQHAWKKLKKVQDMTNGWEIIEKEEAGEIIQQKDTR